LLAFDTLLEVCEPSLDVCDPPAEVKDTLDLRGGLRGVAVVLQWCNNDVTEMLQRCYRGALEMGPLVSLC
jgi:hypothetical protein